jgi:hypothetical protein
MKVVIKLFLDYFVYLYSYLRPFSSKLSATYMYSILLYVKCEGCQESICLIIPPSHHPGILEVDDIFLLVSNTDVLQHLEAEVKFMITMWF